MDTNSYVAANFLSPLASGAFVVQQGLQAQLTANSINLSLNYSEARPQLYLIDSSNAIKQLTSSGNNLLWDGNILAKQSELQQLEPSFTAVSNELVKGFDFSTNLGIAQSFKEGRSSG